MLKKLLDMFSRRVEERWLEAPVKKAPELELEGNRRRNRRESGAASAWCRGKAKTFQRIPVLESSATGARVVLDRNVEDRFDLVLKVGQRFRTTPARVVWAEELPGGVRRVVGVEFYPGG